MQAEEADLVSSTGQQAFTANLDYGIEPILGEGLPGRVNLSSYYSVAVVNAVSDHTFRRTGCSPSHRWNASLATCISAGFLRGEQQDLC